MGQSICSGFCDYVINLLDYIITKYTYMVSEYQHTRLIAEIAVDIFKRSSSSLWIKEVGEWHKRAVEDRPDNIELPL